MAESSMADLRHQVATLRHELTYLQQVLRRKNLELDALHFVWCDGGCFSGVHRWEHGELTEAIVTEAERNTERLRRWWMNHTYRHVVAPRELS